MIKIDGEAEATVVLFNLTIGKENEKDGRLISFVVKATLTKLIRGCLEDGSLVIEDCRWEKRMIKVLDSKGVSETIFKRMLHQLTHCFNKATELMSIEEIGSIMLNSDNMELHVNTLWHYIDDDPDKITYWDTADSSGRMSKINKSRTKTV